MKKSITILLSLAIIISVSACNISLPSAEMTTGATTTETTTESITTETTTESTTTETTTESTTTETTLDNHIVDVIDFSTKTGGTIKYTGCEKPDRRLIEGNSGDLDKIVLLKFAYTNLSSSPSYYQTDFSIVVFQDGVQLIDSVSYSGWGDERQYDLLQASMSTAMNGGTVEFGDLVKLKSRNPLTIIVYKWSDDDYQQMELDVSDV